MSVDDPQLDLLAGAMEIPQANSLSMFVRLLESIADGSTTVDELAESLRVDPRTVRYYVDFGRWLGFLKMRNHTDVSMELVGVVFAENVSTRARIFRDAMFAKPLIKKIRQHREDFPKLSLRKATREVIAASSTLSDATTDRRTSSLVAMLDAIYRPGRIDWESGGRLDQTAEQPSFEFEGRGFLTAMAARAFSARTPYAVGFPHQVFAFVEQEPIRPHVWKRSSHTLGDSIWFGNVPDNWSTRHVVSRGGRDLRRLLVLTVPFVTFAIGLLSWVDASRREPIQMTSDMYGVRIWANGVDRGSLMEVMLELFAASGLEVVESDAIFHESFDGNEDALMAVLKAAGFLRIDGTRLTLAKTVTDEMRETRENASSVSERLEIVRERWVDWLS